MTPAQARAAVGRYVRRCTPFGREDALVRQAEGSRALIEVRERGVYRLFPWTVIENVDVRTLRSSST